MINYKLNLLKLPLDTLKNIQYNFKKVDGCDVLVIKADTIRKETYVCDHCKSIHKHVIKEYKEIYNKYTTLNNILVILNVRKKRFVCNDCKSTFTEKIPSIDKHARISNILKEAIKHGPIINKTGKDTAICSFVSQTTVAKVYATIESSIEKINYNYLPTKLGIDEFKATTDCKSKMACLLVDHDKKQPFDVLPSRKSIDLDKYLNKFSQEAKDKVEIVTMDMYEPYVRLVKRHFKNARIVFDKFHIVQNFTKALNKTRINHMATLETDSKEYKRLKHYWKSILSFSIKPTSNYYNLPLFDYKTNISDVVDTIISYDQTLKDSYNFYQLFFFYLNNNCFETAKLIGEHFKDIVSDKMKTAINTFIKYQEYCKEAYISNYSNALTESIIQKIKLIKRNAYGFRTFKSFKRRIMYYFQTRSIREQLTKVPRISNIRAAF